MNKEKKPDFGAGWTKQGNYGQLISVCLPVEYLQQLLNEAKDGKSWLTLAANSYKKEGSKQPDWKVLGPRKAFNPYEEKLPAAKAQELVNAFNDKNNLTEEDVPF